MNFLLSSDCRTAANISWNRFHFHFISLQPTPQQLFSLINTAAAGLGDDPLSWHSAADLQLRGISNAHRVCVFASKLFQVIKLQFRIKQESVAALCRAVRSEVWKCVVVCYLLHTLLNTPGSAWWGLTNLARLKIKKGSAILELAGILNAVVQKDIPSFYI